MERVDLSRIERVAASAGAATIPSAPTPAEHVARRLDEGWCALIGCAEHFGALAAEGLTELEVRSLRAILEALGQASSYASRREACPDETAARAAVLCDVLYAAAGDAIGRIRARAAFAFRGDPDDARRRVFFSAYAPRLPPRGASRRALCETVELKLR